MLEKLKKNASSLLLLFALISSLFYAFNVLAWQSDLDSLESRVVFNEKAAEKKELMKTVFECKKLYGSDYSSAPDEFTSKFCRDAEIELKNMK
jgi:hypothetical protein